MKHADYQALHRLWSKNVFLKAFIVSYLDKFADLLKLKLADNERVSQCSTCSAEKSGTPKESGPSQENSLSSNPKPHTPCPVPLQRTIFIPCNFLYINKL